jgi:hypothetical protein
MIKKRFPQTKNRSKLIKFFIFSKNTKYPAQKSIKRKFPAQKSIKRDLTTIKPRFYHFHKQSYSSTFFYRVNL